MVNEELVPQFKDERNFWFEHGRTGGYLRFCTRWLEEAQKDFLRMLDRVRELPTHRSHEYGSYIVEAMETRQPTSINGNIRNWGLIDNLPKGCCVEVPCLVDGRGIHPTTVGSLPARLAALNRSNINVQELAVQAALTGDKEAVHHAVSLDPLTAAVCTLPQIHSMVAEMLEAEAEWLPQFGRS
jgi:alpha-galactosidase